MRIIAFNICFLLQFFVTVSWGQTNASVNYCNKEIEDSKLYHKGNIYQKDFLLFAEMLQESHPAFSSRTTPPFSIEKEKKVGYKWAKNCQSTKELSNYIQAILTQLEDGHSLVKVDLDYNQIYPFTFLLDDSKYYLNGIDKSLEHFLGEEILSLNDAPMIDVYDSFKKILSSENEYRFVAQLQDNISFYSHWANTPYHKEDKSLKLMFKGGKSVVLYPVPQKALQISRMQAKISQLKNDIEVSRKKSKLPFYYSIYMTHNICFMQFDQCYDKESLKQYYQNRGASQQENDKLTAAVPDFKQFLDSMFISIDKNSIANLVIDVRYNSGGNSMLVDELLSRIANKNQIKHGTAEIRLSKLWELNFPQLAQSYKQKAETHGVVYSLGKLYNNDEINKLLGINYSSNETTNTQPEGGYFKGRVIFLQGPNTYSSAGMLITTAIDNNIGEVIGCKSTYAPSNYGDMLSWKLPNTAINGFVSHKFFSRPNKTKISERFITPNVSISPYSLFLYGFDAYLDWISNHVR